MRRERDKTAKRVAFDASGASQIGEPLLAWYAKNRRRLPWRDTPTPYSVWVSEIMLQQTRVETVIPYYTRFLERFPRIEDLAEAPLDQVLSLWSGLGYYRRARSLHAGARAVVERHGGEFPRVSEAALEVPGVGPYTAGAVLSIAYNLPEPVVDGNVERVITRIFRIDGNPKAGPVARRLRALARSAIPDGRASEFNQALMELGATVCTPRSPKCGSCPLASICLAREHGDVERYPTPAPRRETVGISLHAALVRRRDELLLEQITSGPYLQGLWLFPLATGEVGADAPSPELLRRLRVLLGATPRYLGPAGRVSHSITFRRLTIETFFFELVAPRRKLAPLPPEFQWSCLDELGKSVPVSSIALKIASRLRSGAPEGRPG